MPRYESILLYLSFPSITLRQLVAHAIIQTPTIQHLMPNLSQISLSLPPYRRPPLSPLPLEFQLTQTSLHAPNPPTKSTQYLLALNASYPTQIVLHEIATYHHTPSFLSIQTIGPLSFSLSPKNTPRTPFHTLGNLHLLQALTQDPSKER